MKPRTCARRSHATRPDGAWIVFTAVTPETRSLWAIPAAGGEPIVLTPAGVYTHGTWQPTPTTT